MIRFSFLIVLSVLLLCQHYPAEAIEGKGELQGKVIDKKTFEELIGATVLIERTKLGAATGLDGSFKIKNIPAGRYTVKVSAVGYRPRKLKIDITSGEVVSLKVLMREGNVMADEVVVGASKYKQNKNELPVTTSVVSASDIAATPIKSLDQVVEKVPGVDLVRSGGAGASSVQIRGSNSYAGGGLGTRILFLYDGFIMNSADAGSVNWQSLMMNSLEQLEVIKGASSALYGSGAMGGVINAIGALPKEFTAKVTFSNGFYNYLGIDAKTSNYPDDATPYFYNIGISHGNKVDNIAYNFAYNHSDDDGFRDASSLMLNDVKLKARYNFTPTHYLQFSGIYTAAEGNIPYPWRQRGDALGHSDPVGGVETDAILNKSSDDLKETETSLAGLTYFNMFGTSSSLEAKLFYTRDYFLIKYYPERIDGIEYQSYLAGRRKPYDSNDSTTYNNSDARRYGANIKFDYYIGQQQHFITGGDFYYDDVESTTYYNNKARTYGLFFQNEYTLSPRFKIQLSLRYDLNALDRETIEYEDNMVKWINQNEKSLKLIGLTPEEAKKEIYGTETPPEIIRAEISNDVLSQLNPRFAMVYQVNEAWSLRASFGRSFRAPTLAERFVTEAGFFTGNPNPDLSAERMTSYELGSFLKISDFASFDAAFYVNTYKDLIEAQNINPFADEVSKVDPFSGTDVIVFQYVNISEARIIGLETNLRIQPTTLVLFQFGYNYMNAKDLQPEASKNRLGGNENPKSAQDWLAYRPEHNFNFGISYTGRLLALNFSGRYVSKFKSVRMYANKDGMDYPGGFFVMDTSARYKLTENFALTGAIKNIGNAEYEELEHYRAPVRSFHFGFDYEY